MVSDRKAARNSENFSQDDIELPPEPTLKLTVSARGPWFQRPYICIPAFTGEGIVTVLVGVDKWQSALKHNASDVRLASEAIFEQAAACGQWRYYEGQPAILVA